MTDDEMRDLWNEEPVDPVGHDAVEEGIRAVVDAERAAALMGAVGLLAAAAMALSAWLLPHLRLPLLLLGAATAWTVFARWRWGTLPVPPALPLNDHARSWGTQLLRQARWLGWAPLVAFGPPALALGLLSARARNPERVDLVLIGAWVIGGTIAHWRAAAERRRLALRLLRGGG